MEDLLQDGAEVLRGTLGHLVDIVEAADTIRVSVLAEAASKDDSNIGPTVLSLYNCVVIMSVIISIAVVIFSRLVLQRLNSRLAVVVGAKAVGLNDHGAPIRWPVLDEFLAAAASGDTQCLGDLLALHSPCDLVVAKDKSGCNALMLAAYHGHPDCIRLLLPYSPGSQLAVGTGGQLKPLSCAFTLFPGCTSLMLAAAMGHTVCVRLLLEHCPEVQVASVNVNHGTALMLAAIYGRATCVQLLLAQSPQAQMAAVTKGGKSALGFAVCQGHAACVHLLLSHNPDSQQLNSALLGACREYQKLLPAVDLSRCTQCMELLLAEGAFADVAIVRRIMHDLAKRALVPDRVNEAIASLALTHSGQRNADNQAQA